LITQSSVSKEELGSFLEKIVKLASSCNPDKGCEYYESAFGDAWEDLVDKKQPSNHLFFFPATFVEDKSNYVWESPPKLSTLLERQESKGPVVVEGLLPNSNYISALPEY
jgi:hypothetical protein